MHVNGIEFEKMYNVSFTKILNGDLNFTFAHVSK